MRDLWLADFPFLREFGPRLRFGSGHVPFFIGLSLDLFIVHEQLCLMLLWGLLHDVNDLLLSSIPLPRASIDFILALLDPLVPYAEDLLESLLDSPEYLVLAHKHLPYLLFPRKVLRGCIWIRNERPFREQLMRGLEKGSCTRDRWYLF